MKSLLTKSLKTIRRAAAAGLLVMLASSCQWMSEDYDEIVDSNATQYINITISVSAGNVPVTRANPTGGQWGDGSEEGQVIGKDVVNENKVDNITVIFYSDPDNANTNINTTSDNAKVVCVRTYSVHPITSGDYPYAHQHLTGETTDYQGMEKLYSTGEQPLVETTLEEGKTYGMLIVANTNGLTGITEGTTTIKTVRDMLAPATLYSGTGVGADAKNFVMTSKNDVKVTLTNPYVYTSTTITEKNRRVFYLDCIHVERLAARIDYWAKGSNGYKTKNKNNGDYTVPGYEYTVVKENGTTDSGDRFVLTRITPFNLNNGDEYLLKRTTTGFSSTGFDANAPITYLANEVASGTGVNWVLDPNTLSSNTETPLKNNTTAKYANYNCKLSDVITTFEQTGHTITMADQQANKFDVGTDAVKDNIIVGYAKENTLIPGVSPLYYHATGLAFEGYYYENGTGNGVKRIYYYFIRHQGTQDTAYEAFTTENINTDATKALPCPATTAMNFGIVRNNIYRISIDKITEDMKIKVKMWDTFTHSVIYM